MTEDAHNLSLIWPGVSDLPTVRANQVLAQFEQDGHGGNSGIVLTLGYVAPPVLLGSPEEQAATLGALRAIPVRPITKLSISRQTLGEWAQVLAMAVEQWDSQQGAGEG